MTTLSTVGIFCLTALIGIYTVGARCPRYCVCYFDSIQDLRAVSCVGRRLDNIDLLIPKRVQLLDLSNNSISVLEDQAFQNCGLREIIKLTLNHNSVQTIGLHSFVGLPHLQWLDLSGNSLYQILPWTFYDNKNLRFINLSENPLGHITHTGPLLNVPSLEILLLIKCNFAHVAEDAFSDLPNLRILDLSQNQLISFDVYSLYLLHNLQELNISSNPWQCNEQLEDLNTFLESRSCRLIGSSCDEPGHLTMHESTFERIISYGAVHPEYGDVAVDRREGNEHNREITSKILDNSSQLTMQEPKFNKIKSDGFIQLDYGDVSVESSESDEHSEETTASKKLDDSSKCAEKSGVLLYKEYFILSPALLSLVSFQLGVLTTLCVGYFYTRCRKQKKLYDPLMPHLTGSGEAIDDQPMQGISETLVFSEAPPPSYRELFMCPRPP